MYEAYYLLNIPAIYGYFMAGLVVNFQLNIKQSDSIDIKRENNK